MVYVVCVCVVYMCVRGVSDVCDLCVVYLCVCDLCVVCIACVVCMSLPLHSLFTHLQMPSALLPPH